MPVEGQTSVWMLFQNIDLLKLGQTNVCLGLGKSASGCINVKLQSVNFANDLG